MQAYYVESQGLSAEDGHRILASTGTTTFPALDDALVARQQGTIDVIDGVGELPVAVDAAEGFDRRFDGVIEEAAASAGATYTRGETS
ncbi:hypothetical protein [Rhodococcus rhodnii]|uniref:Uncharacterized protein n=1 Tax=Rhodococcus rhodnii LMG 5362 TaxID=1273125 RepID=R7WUS7_9NOCA|nr:hypothetical protein [Rhodococcus rhodnii]EOM77884.1 hypothetical protein Rrhod_0777 [Rhodococcus rhodnii LMG 5362]